MNHSHNPHKANQVQRGQAMHERYLRRQEFRSGRRPGFSTTHHIGRVAQGPTADVIKSTIDESTKPWQLITRDTSISYMQADFLSGVLTRYPLYRRQEERVVEDVVASRHTDGMLATHGLDGLAINRFTLRKGQSGLLRAVAVIEDVPTDAYPEGLVIRGERQAVSNEFNDTRVNTPKATPEAELVLAKFTNMPHRAASALVRQLEAVSPATIDLSRIQVV